MTNYWLIMTQQWMREKTFLFSVPEVLTFWLILLLKPKKMTHKNHLKITRNEQATPQTKSKISLIDWFKMSKTTNRIGITRDGCLFNSSDCNNDELRRIFCLFVFHAVFLVFFFFDVVLLMEICSTWIHFLVKITLSNPFLSQKNRKKKWKTLYLK